MADTEKTATQTSAERGQRNPNHRGRRNYRNKRPANKKNATAGENTNDAKNVNKDQTTAGGTAAEITASEPAPVVENNNSTNEKKEGNSNVNDEAANGSDGVRKAKKKNNRRKNNKKDNTKKAEDKDEVKDELSKKWGFDKDTSSQKFRIFTDEEGTIMLELLDYNITSILQQETQWESLYNNKPKVSVYEFLDLLPRLKKVVVDNDSGYDTIGLKMVVAYLEHVFEEVLGTYEKMTQKGVVSYSGLGYMFRKDVKVYVVDNVMDEKVAIKITRSEYVRGFFSYFRISGTSIRTDGKKLIKCAEVHTISAFKGVKKFGDLPVKPLTDEVAKELTERGKIFRKYAIGNHYLHLTGNMFQESWWRPVLFKAQGRVMIDGASFRRFNPNYQLPSETDEKIEELNDDDLWQAHPYVYGFSFVAKKWGEIPVSQLTEINFDDTAFDKLVLPAEKKKLISALVKFQDRAFTDIITGKGGGCIFLLHGSPGVGKTLTAESLAELMHKPLYSVTVGELGTTTDSLEENLSKVLELAATWKAVILLDEADIFLEERSKNDIARNAMVGIFLRLLEYHQGVLFLTTNRVKNFDPAFHSRISIALKYHDLDTDAREQIWTNLLSAAKIEGINPKEFSHYEINGRQIKNSIRLAQALAASEDLPVTKEFLLQTVGVARQFQTDLLESIVVREAHDAIVQQAIDESVKEEASKLRVSNELLRKSINLDEKK